METAKSAKRVLITTGEPAGVGPDIIVQMAQHDFDAELVVVGDPELLMLRAKTLGLPLHLNECDIDRISGKTPAQSLKIIPVYVAHEVKPRKLDPANAKYVIETISLASNLCLRGKAHALVTAPVHKGIINDAGITFTGHTELLADLCKVSHTVMFFVVNDLLKVALVTTHLPLAKVAQSITKSLLATTFNIVIQALQQQFNVSSPKLFVCGLNPHAGEGGHLGREEIEVISPVIQAFQQQGHNIVGPLPADTIFTPKYLKEADAFVAMYHDQALPLVKYAGFGNAVNVTLGLPFIRTSVDHGTALDIAGTTQADATSLCKAIELAIKF